MRKCIFVIVLCFISSSALCQQQPNQLTQSTAADRLATSLGKLLIQLEQQNDIISNLNSQLAKAQDEIKTLKEKK